MSARPSSLLPALVLAQLLGGCSGQVNELWTSCQVIFAYPDGPKISVSQSVISMTKHNCSFWLGINERYGGALKVNAYGPEAFSPGSPDDQFMKLSDAMAARDPRVEVIDLDPSWTHSFLDDLTPLPPRAFAEVRDKFLTKNWHGDVVAAAIQPRTLHMFYRKDLFAQEGVAYSTASWSAWLAGLTTLQEKLRVGDSEFSALYLNGVPTGDGDSVIHGYVTALLSGYGIDSVVDASGTTFVDSPDGIKALSQLLQWKSILHPASFTDGADGLQMLRSGRAAVTFAYVDDARDLPTWRVADKVDIEICPMPGQGKGVALRGFNVAMSKHTREKELAYDIMEAVAWAQPRWPLSSGNPVAQEPVSRVTQGDAAVWAEYCGQAKTMELCRELEADPGFWSLPAAHPFEGCGVSLARCTVAVENAWAAVFHGAAANPDPASIAKGLKDELYSTIERWQTRGAHTSVNGWTADRICLILVCVGAAGVLAVLVALMRGRFSKLRKATRCHVPIPAFLGILVLILFCVIQVVGIVQWDSAMVDVSEELGVRVQLEVLKATNLRLSLQVDSEMTAWKAGKVTTTEHMKSVVVSQFITSVEAMGMDDRSLALLLDRDHLVVAASSDPSKQLEGVSFESPFSSNVSEWMRAVFTVVTYDNLVIGGITPSVITEAKVDGKRVLINMETAGASVTIGGVKRTLQFVVIYIVPDGVLYHDRNEILALSVNLAGLLSVVGLVTLILLATLISAPLVALASDMEKVRTMRVDEIDLEKDSRLLEVGSLLVGFKAMCSMLIEYKSFMPKTLFSMDTSDTSESEFETKLTQKDSLGSSRTNNQSAPAAHAERRKQNGVSNHLGLGALSQTQGTILVVTLIEELNKDMSTTAFETLLNIVERSTTTGVLHPFTTVRPNELVISWGIVTAYSSVRVTTDKAATAALDIRKHCSGNDLRVGIAGVSGSFNSGNIGNKKTRGFAIFGASVPLLGSAVRSSVALAKAFAKTTIVVTPEFTKVQGFEHRVVDSIQAPAALIALHELCGKHDVEEQEWMYQLRELEQKNRDPEKYCVFLESFLAAKGPLPETLTSFLSDSKNELDELVVMNDLRALLDARRMMNDISLCSLITRYLEAPRRTPSESDD